MIGKRYSYDGDILFDEEGCEELSKSDACDIMNELSAENELLRTRKSRFERKYYKLMVDHVDLELQLRRKTVLVSDLEEKVKRQKMALRELQK